MAPVYEGKTGFENVLVFCFFSTPLVCGAQSLSLLYQLGYNWIAADTEAEMRCTLSSFTPNNEAYLYIMSSKHTASRAAGSPAALCISASAHSGGILVNTLSDCAASLSCVR